MSNFEGKIHDVTKQAVKEVYGLDVGPDTLVVEVPRNKDNGDYATGVAMKLARELHKSPVEIAEAIAAKLRELLPEAESVTVAKPGFINFKLSSEALTSLINQVLDQGDNYGQNNSGEGVRILVEWVSANPTGDLHCGHARNAAWGDSICRLLEKSGYDVLREFYVNDAGNQIVMLGESLVSRYFEFFGKEYPLPENGYHADDVKQIAKDIAKEDGDKWLTADANERLHYFMQQGIDRELAKIDRDLKLYRVNITSWMHETFFYQNDMKRIKDCLKMMDDKGLLYEKDGALWFKSTDYGDDKDRVLRKSDGTLSYLTPDIANHVYKMERGYPVMVNLWGADHHSYVTRMQAALTALGYPKGTLSVELIQMVRMVEDGVEVKMSKRTGNAITLRELCEDVGVDAARWFFNGKPDSPMEFDLGLAVREDSENPVYYVQYAHARICSLIARLAEEGDKVPDAAEVDPAVFSTEEEKSLIKTLSQLPETIRLSARDYDPSHVNRYLTTLAGEFHRFYNSCRIKGEAPEVLAARLKLSDTVRAVIANCLALLGVSAPEKM